MSDDKPIFSLTITGVSAKWVVYGVRGIERMNEPFSFDVWCAPASAVKASDLLTKPAKLTLHAQHDRVFEVIVDRADARDGNWDLRLVPLLATLADTKDYKIFLDEDSVSIATEILSKHAITLDNKVSRSLPKRPQRLQAFESELAFVSRILSEDGLSFFLPVGQKDTVVVNEDPSGFKDAEGVGKLPVRHQAGLQQGEESVFHWSVRHVMVQTKVHLRDYNFEKPQLDQNASNGTGNLECYEYPGGYADPSAGNPIAKMRLEALRARRIVLSGATNCRGLAPGYVVTLSHETNHQVDGRWLVLEVEHESEDVRTGSGEIQREVHNRYEARFVAVPAATAYRPPVVRGARMAVQTATVTGPSGAEIHTEKYGRMKMQLRWDRLKPVDDTASAWTRVMQPPTSGSMFLPRTGWEELIGFFDASGDYPFQLGRVYNGVATPPNGLPGDKVVSAFGSATTPGGGSKNLFATNDTSGSEGFSIVASKDLNSKTENDKVTGITANDTHNISANHTLIVGNSHELGVTASQTYSIGASRTVNVDANKSVTAASETVMVGGLRMFNVGGDYQTGCASLTRLVGASKVETAIEQQARTVTGAATVLIGGTWKTTAAANAGVNVLGASTQLVSGAKSIKTPKYALNVRGIYSETLASRTIKAGGARGEKFGAAAKYDISGSADIKGANVEIEAKSKITIKAGGATIEITPSSVTVDADWDGSGQSSDTDDEKYD